VLEPVMYLSSLTPPEWRSRTEALVAEVNESSSVSVLDGDDIVYVARVPTRRIMTVAISVGTRFPAYATSMGRVLLAGLADPELDATSPRWTSPAPPPEQSGRSRPCGGGPRSGTRLLARRPGTRRGPRAAAAPIRDRTGKTIASVNISAHAHRTSLESMRRTMVPPLLAAAARISTDLPASTRSSRASR
jgi:IclR family pca regulon transcriptional regulator